MPIPRCDHGNYNGSVNGAPAFCCSGCNPRSLPRAAKKTRVIAEVPTRCPECGSAKDWKFIDQYRFKCGECGFES